MKFFDRHHATRWWPAAAVATVLTLTACGGGYSNSGTGSAALPTPDTTPPAPTPAILELTNAFAATLTGAQEVPSRQTAARGAGTVVI
ncbi:MAG: hypothetical protein ACREX0_15750, partial [Noviherbaspirillum sp.]